MREKKRGLDFFQEPFDDAGKGFLLSLGEPGNDLLGHLDMEIMVLFKVGLPLGGQFN